MTAVRFLEKTQKAISKNKITVLQINLGRKCNLSCSHCHVEASPKRTEEISDDVKYDIIQLIRKFSQIESVDLTGGAPEFHSGFRDIVKAAWEAGKEVIVRSNLVILLEEGYRDLPDFFVKHGVRLVASLPCYLEENVDSQRGAGTYNKSIEAIRILNQKGYGDSLTLDLVYNPAIPKTNRFSLAPNQKNLEVDYKKHLKENFDIGFNSLLTFTNLPIGRFNKHLRNHNLENAYLDFLETNYNPSTLSHLMCRNMLSLNYRGHVYDCDFNQIQDIPALSEDSDSPVTIKSLLTSNSLDIISGVAVGDHCFGCTAGSGSSCAGSLI